ncbi:UDP-N-acetylmuramoyl-tripeptide--D-alanyl-D-alanine ligase [Asaia bogorensis]|uniref:UDP-N-acetylmuramoyl-tripeptide--D-alanyl-D-alanine ligase n=1 Tax=Asaia bogorensis NBRC 16594 TaxID=1231624 RepID=A0AAN4R3R3_9PROT|nr:UDP-N-acetylmuramoyl-tripeptide--D-alanyl-D-alanine ligase [Asaia bogorensis]BAT19310.1 UDP-N-acetylmuramoyl-tripeptide--D-alanyl-D-alanine ligase [Asaia bogorensis NBRC 16594]GBQ82248.1 UDP-N-acetylmuramoyl-tripeptide--D-alanyl-D-alanine ligase [Asaia bogorensis NBRC 16594]GEL54195.1 UDP-N-acetylmuramoyl-tripeptide--D-alanyl-D-alanine ligase [Asaia bogorensis NBRC 16594]
MTPIWTSTELREATSGQLIADVAVTGISIDTRTLEPGDLFIALVGDTSDGHAHIATALERGAACVMVHSASGSDDPRLLHVQDTMQGLRALAQAARARFAGVMIGVTGSVGKTTTKNMLHCALSALGPTHAAVASYNNHWGVPLTLARMPRNAAFCVAEIGMNHRGEIAPLAGMVRPDAAVITTIGSSHLGYMGSVEAIAEEKSDLIRALSNAGAALVPDDTGLDAVFEDAAAQAGCRLAHVGLGENADYRLNGVHTTPEGSQFTLGCRDGTNHVVTLAAPGAHLVRNAGMALATLQALGLPLAPPIAALAAWRPGAGRGQIQPIMAGQAALLDESYNASVLSIRAALETLSLVPGERKIAVLGDIRELGDFAESEHLSLVPDVTANADLVFCCCPHMRHVFDALPEEKRGVWQSDAASLAPFVQSNLKAGDVVLVKGSLGSRMRDIVTPLLAGGVQA